MSWILLIVLYFSMFCVVLRIGINGLESARELELNFVVDYSSDLIENLKHKYLIGIFNLNCNISCIIQCGYNGSCATAIYSYADRTCSMYNMSFCKNQATIFNDSTVLYKKMDSKQSLSHYK